MSIERRFVNLIHSCVDAGEHQPDINDNQCLLVTSGRTFHFDLRLERKAVVVSTMIYFANEDPFQVHPDLIDAFNVYHLFRGGYRLGVDPETLSLYVSCVRSLDRLEAMGGSAFLEDFVERCASCSRWYMGEIESRMWDCLVAAESD